MAWHSILELFATVELFTSRYPSRDGAQSVTWRIAAENVLKERLGLQGYGLPKLANKDLTGPKKNYQRVTPNTLTHE